MQRFMLSKDDCAIIVVDIQEKLVPAMPCAPAVVSQTLNLIELAKIYKIPVLVTEQYPKGLGNTVEEIKIAVPTYSPFEKVSFSCCGSRGFIDALNKLGRKKLILVGMETHVCVLQTCLDLLKAGFIVHVVSDAVCSRSAENRAVGIEMMRSAGAVITCTETALFQLLKAAGSDEFKAISKRIK